MKHFALLVALFLKTSYGISTNGCFALLSSPSYCTLNENGCLTNPAFMAMVGPSIPYIHNVCDWSQPYIVAPAEHNYGCDADDNTIDFMRLGSTFGYFGYLESIYSLPKETCYNKQACVAAFHNLMEKDVMFELQSGFGMYKGIEEACDVIGISTPAVGRGLNHLTNTPTPFDYAVFGPTMLIFGMNGNSATSFNHTTSGLYNEAAVGFKTCGTKLDSVSQVDKSILSGRQTNLWTEMASFYQAQKYDIDQFSILNICKTHTLYCTGAAKQFSSMGDCVKHMKSLPLFTAQCGTARFLQGNALPCKAKFALMAPINPKYCYALGALGTQDPEGVLRCDPSECTGISSPFPYPISDLDFLNLGAYSAYANAQTWVAPNVCA